MMAGVAIAQSSSNATCCTTDAPSPTRVIADSATTYTMAAIQSAAMTHPAATRYDDGSVAFGEPRPRWPSGAGVDGLAVSIACEASVRRGAQPAAMQHPWARRGAWQPDRNHRLFH